MGICEMPQVIPCPVTTGDSGSSRCNWPGATGGARTRGAAPVPDRRPAVLQRALAAAADMIAPVLADVAVTSARRVLQRRRVVASPLRRRLVSAARELPRSGRTP
jgi:hypothetical protein